ncbi:prolyl oligopeptidase family serine peptidase [Streptomyces sp. NBC_00988]|uniref:prolyl oligopeptidase family serine peptidase n=1 Tax=Streptomyces sp. NBC_00988 TaxID=2903704 RepID=UPI00386A23DF|nr:prolyl oligopeptidase family serine peptidase [Streptomyces sp. NBC_00988]
MAADEKSGTQGFPEGVMGVTALTSVVRNTASGNAHFTRQVVAVAIRFLEEVDGTCLSPGMFAAVTDYADPAVPPEVSPRDAVATAVYTNSVPELRTDGSGRPGRYVIVEIDPNAQAARTLTIGVRCPLHRIPARVRIDGDVLGVDGRVLAPRSDAPLPMTEPARHLDTGRFVPLVLTNDDGNPVYVHYALPVGYRADGAYPMVVHLTGQGQQYMDASNSVNFPVDDPYAPDNNFGANLVSDGIAAHFSNHSEPTVVVSVQVRGDQDIPYATKYVYPGFDGPRDIAMVIEHFLAEFAVDADRVYAVGNSGGGMLLSTTIFRRPDLVAAYLLVNGPIVFGDNEAELDSYIRTYADSRIAVWMCRGRSDRGPDSAELPARMLRESYRDQGLPEAETDSLVRCSIYEDEEFHRLGSRNYHGATTVLFSSHYEDVARWLFAWRKYRRPTADAAAARDLTAAS